MQSTFPSTDLTSFLAAERAARLQSDARRQRMLRRMTRTVRRNSLRSP